MQMDPLNVPVTKKPPRRSRAARTQGDTKVSDETSSTRDDGSFSTETSPPLDSLKSRFNNLIIAKQNLITDLKREIKELRNIQREYDSSLRIAQKVNNTKKKALRDISNTRKPSGFASPVFVSDDLYTFLERYSVKRGEPIARTDVTRYIAQYIKDNDLQNPDARREILPDAVLLNLFGSPQEHRDPSDPNSPKVFTYLRLQKYLTPHFPKKK